MHVHGSPRVHTRIHTPHAGIQREPLSLHTHGDTHRWSRAFTPALQHFPTHHTHSQAGPAGHTHTNTHTSARSTQQAQNQPAQPSVRFPPPGRRKLAAAESAPGCRQGHRQGKGEGGGQLVGLEGQRSQQPPPSSPIAGAQTPAIRPASGVSLPPRSSFQRGFLYLDSPVSFTPCLAAPRLTWPPLRRPLSLCSRGHCSQTCRRRRFGEQA